MEDRYQVKHLLEEISYGKYFIAEDTFIKRDVQVFYYSAPDGDAWKEAFNVASADMATVSHPGLPIVYNHGIDDDGPYTLRQYVDSATLNTHLAEHGPLGEYEGWELAQQILEIHDVAKPSNNFHGALDPDNINLTARPSGQKLYVVADYGIAAIYKKFSGESGYLGAPYLISPEQAAGEEASESSQLYSIGQLIYHALTGGHPWIESSAEEVAELQKGQALEPISAYNQAIPEAFVNWLSKMISIDPAERFSSYAEATQALPQPEQAAPVPVSTSTQGIQPAATISTSTQGIQPAAGTDTGAQGVSAAEAFAAQQEAKKQQKQAEMAEKTAIFKKPAVLGGIAAGVIGLVAVIALSGGDEPATGSINIANLSQQTKQELSVLPEQELVAYINFAGNSLKALNNPQLALEPLLKEPRFTKEGRSGTGLFLNKNYSFRLSLEQAGIALNDSSYTVSFWIKPSSSSDTELSVSNKNSWDEGQGSGSKQWNPDEAIIAGKSWNMVTIVHESSSESVTIYLDGKEIERNSSTGLNDFSEDPYIYLGNYKNESGAGMPPSVIDSFAVWKRPLSEIEIETLANN